MERQYQLTERKDRLVQVAKGLLCNLKFQICTCRTRGGLSPQVCLLHLEF